MYWFQRWFEKITETLHSESSTIQESIKSQGDAIRRDSESAKHEQNAAAQIIARAINAASNTTSSYEQPQRDKEYRIQVFLTILTFLAAGGAIAAAVGSWYAFPAIKESADAAKKAADTAASALKENQRQFDATSAINQKQFADTLEQMKGQTAAAESSAQNAAAIQRPWIRMALKLSHFTQIAQGYDLTTIPILKNVGSGVASDVNYRIEFRVPPIPASGGLQRVNEFTVAWAVKDWCKTVKPTINDRATIFPGDTPEPVQYTVNVLSSDMGKSGFRLNGEERYQVLVYGCVLYRFKPFQEWHHTAIVYQLSALENGVSHFLKPRQNYTLDNLLFIPFPFSPEWGD